MGRKMMIPLSYFLIGIWLMTGSAFAEPLDNFTAKFILNVTDTLAVGGNKNKEGESRNLKAQNAPEQRWVSVGGVNGMNWREAKVLLESRGLKVAPNEVKTSANCDPSNAGKVIGVSAPGTSPIPGTAEVGTLVTLSYCAEQRWVSVGGVNGMNRREAKALLESRGLRVALNEVTASVNCDPSNAGKVTGVSGPGTSPIPGTAEVGTVVTLSYCAEQKREDRCREIGEGLATASQDKDIARYRSLVAQAQAENCNFYQNALVNLQNMERQATIERADCSRWPGSISLWNNQTNRAECFCPQGMIWNKDRTMCIDARQAAVENTDCSRWPGSVAMWNNQTNRAECFCPQGMVWNQNRTACISARQQPPPPTGPTPTGPPRQVKCNDTAKQGGNTPETLVVDLGRTSGVFRFDYNMFDVPDRMIVRYGGGTYDTQCTGGKQGRGRDKGSVNLQFFGSSQVTIQVQPACQGGSTSWNFTVHCPK